VPVKDTLLLMLIHIIQIKVSTRSDQQIRVGVNHKPRKLNILDLRIVSLTGQRKLHRPGFVLAAKPFRQYFRR
jgi:hypothetical protein